ncbi:DedA family protein [Micromonospora pisi]|nr:DedA family protein [Micromonospora pisi]
MDAVLELLTRTMTSPWVYLAIFAIAVVDGFFPVVPSETAVITAGVFAATGGPDLLLVMAVAATGAFVGDHVSYLIGRTGGSRVTGRLRPGGRRYAAYTWARAALLDRGGLALIVARYVPGGRTAITVTMGTVGYPRRRFHLFDAVAACSWALYSALVGYLGGVAFEHDPIRGLLLGLGIAFTVTVAVEAVRYLRRRSGPRPAPGATAAVHAGAAAGRGPGPAPD